MIGYVSAPAVLVQVTGGSKYRNPVPMAMFVGPAEQGKLGNDCGAACLR